MFGQGYVDMHNIQDKEKRWTDIIEDDRKDNPFRQVIETCLGVKTDPGNNSISLQQINHGVKL